MISITDCKHMVEKQPLRQPFGFKGHYIQALWQSVVGLYDDDDALGIGVGVQSVIWSDERMLTRRDCGDGEQIMAEMTRYGLSMIHTNTYATPLELIDHIVPIVHRHGCALTNIVDLRKTFTLNSLVAIDQAAWALYYRKHRVPFEHLVPAPYRKMLAERQNRLASIPLVPYAMGEDGIRQLLEDGYFILKIKLGADPEGDGDVAKMIDWDKQRLDLVHRIASDYTTQHTKHGRIVYYLDANGRYDNKEHVLSFLDHADRIGALERIILFEEPFAEEKMIDLSDLPVRFVADESVHDETDARARIDLGYGAFALKPVAKTMSESLKIAKMAYERGIPCFCADLTANPILADWNKNLACRLAPLPELTCNIIETNGHQNYTHWEGMKAHHPRHGAPWIDAKQGMYALDQSFHETLGGALECSPYYAERLAQQTSTIR